LSFLTTPLDPARHDREAFSSGVRQVDNFFRKTANKLNRADNLRTFILEGIDGGVIGYYALNAFSIDYADLPDRYARNRPAQGKIPAVFVSMIGIDSRFQGQGMGQTC
jgi:hypothetical protein